MKFVQLDDGDTNLHKMIDDWGGVQHNMMEFEVANRWLVSTYRTLSFGG